VTTATRTRRRATTKSTNKPNAASIITRKPRAPATVAAAAAAAAKKKKRGANSQFIIDSDDDDEEAELEAEEFDLEADYDSEAEAEDGAYVLGAADEEFHDFSDLELKPDHQNRPLWVCPDGRVFLETFSPVYKQAYDFLIAVAEPVSRPECIHEYMLTPHSLYAAVSIGLDTSTIVGVLDRLSKTRLPSEIRWFVRESTENYGKVKLVLQKNAFFVESPYPEVLKKLLRDETIQKARVVHSGSGGGAGAGNGGSEFVVGRALKDRAVDTLAAVGEIDLTGEELDMDLEEEEAAGIALEEEEAMAAAMAGNNRGGVNRNSNGAAPMQTDITTTAGAGPSNTTTAALPSQQQQQLPSQQQQLPNNKNQKSAYLLDAAAEEDPEKETHSFEIQGSQVEHVKQRCLPGGLNYPMLEEYDFRGDTTNPTLNFELKPHVKHRPYQEKSLSKMFGNSRARSGIIVLPCGAGKSLVGVSAAARIRKSCLCLCTNAVSVDQWKYQFQLWTTLRDDQICRFTADKHEWFSGSGAGICITTYTMVAYSGRRSEESQRIMNDIMSREWGLILLDEVHVVPAQMFRRVLGIVKAHCKLGLTATLVREDQLITDLNFLIGPKLYEANWLDLTRAGHIANVQCAEVWCPMTPEFMREYRRKERTAGQKQLLYVMNPSKMRACQYLVQYHENRGDKVIVFSDNLFALREYAVRMKKPFLYGGTGHQERTRVLHAFKTSSAVNTVFLSKIGDNSLDIPEANVLIQISSHGGSRRQEAQRLGRILRKKKARAGSGVNPGEEFDAFFYSLVSTDTQEVYFTSKRQQFLIDQGYAYKVIPSLLETAGVVAGGGVDGGGQLLLSSQDEQLDLLAAVLHASEAEIAAEELPDGGDGLGERQSRGGVASRRVVGNMAMLSGGQGLKYLEYSTRGGAGGRGGRGGGRRAGPSKFAKFRK
jgi:DNA excision repair protein ERCC-3